MIPYLDGPTTRWNALAALRWVGGVRTLLRIYPWQGDKDRPRLVKEAVFYIAERAIGDGIAHGELMNAARALAAKPRP